MPITWRNVAAPQNYAGSQQFGQGVRTVMDAADNLVQFGQQEQRNNIGQLTTAQTEAAERSLLDIASLSSEELEQRQEAMRANPEQFQERYGDNFGRVNEATQNRQNEVEAENRAQNLFDMSLGLGEASPAEIRRKANDATTYEGLSAEESTNLRSTLLAEAEQAQVRHQEMQLQQRNETINNLDKSLYQRIQNGEINTYQARDELLSQIQNDPEWQQELLSSGLTVRQYVDEFVSNVYTRATTDTDEDVAFIQNFNAQAEAEQERFVVHSDQDLRELQIQTLNQRYAGDGSATGDTAFRGATQDFISAYADQGIDENTVRSASNRIESELRRLLNIDGSIPEGAVRSVMDRAVVDNGWWRSGSIDTDQLDALIRQEADIIRTDIDSEIRNTRAGVNAEERRLAFVNHQNAAMGQIRQLQESLRAEGRHVSLREAHQILVSDPDSEFLSLDARGFRDYYENQLRNQEEVENALSGQLQISQVVGLVEQGLLNEEQAEHALELTFDNRFGEIKDIARRNTASVTQLEDSLKELKEAAEAMGNQDGLDEIVRLESTLDVRDKMLPGFILQTAQENFPDQVIGASTTGTDESQSVNRPQVNQENQIVRERNREAMNNFSNEVRRGLLQIAGNALDAQNLNVEDILANNPEMLLESSSLYTNLRKNENPTEIINLRNRIVNSSNDLEKEAARSELRDLINKHYRM